jgi:hypothetical protein
MKRVWGQKLEEACVSPLGSFLKQTLKLGLELCRV